MKPKECPKTRYKTTEKNGWEKMAGKKTAKRLQQISKNGSKNKPFFQPQCLKIKKMTIKNMKVQLNWWVMAFQKGSQFPFPSPFK